MHSPVERVARIGWESIVVDVVAIASFVHRPLALMAIAAERAQRTQDKLIVIAAMSWVMIGDRRRR
jgi:hypothetical protein